MDQENKIRDGTQGIPQPLEQLSDILLVMDMEKKTISAAKDEKGKTVPFDEKTDDQPFLKIDKGNILANFVSNYLRQARKPTHFRFFRVPLYAARKAMHLFRELLRNNPSQQALEFARQHEVKPEQALKHQNENNENNKPSKEQKMSQNQETQTQPAQAENASKYRYNEAMINWDQLKHFGISRDQLKEMGLLDEMLKGYKSTKLVPITANFGSAVLRTDARLSLQQSQEGPVVLAMHGIRKEPELNRPYFGHVFSDEDKKNLKESGNMGRQVMMSVRGSDEKVPYLISIDKMTNEIVATRADKVFVPDEVSGVKLTDHEKNELREGKAIFVDGMTSKKGKEFSAHLQISAEKRGIEYIFPNDGQFNKQSIGGVELTPKQLEDLNTGKAIFVEDMKKKTGETFSSFIKLDGNGNPSYTRFNPDTPEGSREIYIPKEICNVRLEPEDRERLREGKPVFLEGMVNRKGEEFSSFVKIDTETGKISYAKTEDGFNQKTNFKIPQEVWGVTLKATERAQLQDGKAVYVADMTGFNGQKFSSWIKVNQNQGKLDYYNENPDKPKQQAGQTNNAQATRQDSKQQQPEKEARKQGQASKPKRQKVS